MDLVVRLRSKLRDVSFITYGLFCVFGLGSWVAINGVWAELPVLALALPECYGLAAILSVIIQLANVGPLVLTIAKLIWRKLGWNQLHLEIVSVGGLVMIGLTSTIFLSLFWFRVDTIAGQQHSVALIALVFFLSLVDCSSSVVFVPFMKHYPVVYLSALYIGEGLSGVLPSVIALIQGSVNNSLHCRTNFDREPELGVRFHSGVYFILLAVMITACGVGFLSILLLPQPRKEKKKAAIHALLIEEDSNSSDSASIHSVHGIRDSRMANDSQSVSDKALLISSTEENGDVSKQQTKPVRQFRQASQSPPPPPPPPLSLSRQVLRVLWSNLCLLMCIFILSFLTNGALSSVSSFAFGIYGNQVFHLAVNLGLLANPAATLMYAIMPVRSPLLTAFLTAVSVVFGVYIIIVAAMTHNPPILGVVGGVTIVSHTSHTLNITKLMIK